MDRNQMSNALVQAMVELLKIRQVEKCTHCECLLDVVGSVIEDIDRLNIPDSANIRKELKQWVDQSSTVRHTCLGCEVCLPIEPYNLLNRILNRETGESPVCSECEVDGRIRGGDDAQPLEVPMKWPIVEGNYLVGDPSRSVAVCTLADTDILAECQTSGLIGRIAIVGSLATENIGIERMVRNIVANPFIRCLILCGRDSRGHHAGQAVLSLKQNGVDANRRIIGAQGPRPVLLNIDLNEIAVFRQRVTVVDEIGTTDLIRLKEIVDGCQKNKSAVAPAFPASIFQPKTVEILASDKPVKWEPDPEGFFIILINKEEGRIICESYSVDGTLREVLRGVGAEDMAKEAIRRGLLSRLDHAAYLGAALVRAEISLRYGSHYTQD